MEHTWRRLGDRHPITPAQVRRTGATGVLPALHDRAVAAHPRPVG